MDEGPIEIGPVIMQVLDDLLPSDEAKEFRDTLLRQTREKMEAILSKFEREVAFDVDPHELGMRLAQDILREQELLHEQLATLMQWDRERDSRDGRS